MQTPIYLDHMATTPVDPRVLEAMLPYFSDTYGNAASAHCFGWAAAEAVAHGRSQVARLVGARSPAEIIFTSGATEANNLAIKGLVAASRQRTGHIITSAIEHRSVLDTCGELEAQGYRVTCLPVDHHGCVQPQVLHAALSADTLLVSIMAANNEIGTIQPLREIGDLLRESGIPWHCDAVQAVGRIPLLVDELGISLLTLSAHKMYGPKGIGALYVRSRHPRIHLREQIVGGGQERGRRSGTLNVSGIVGLGKAAELMAGEQETEGARQGSLRHELWHGLLAGLDGVTLNGHPCQRLPGNLHVSFAHVDGAALLAAFRDIALSAGSACADAGTASHVLAAIGRDKALALASLRFGLGRFTTTEQITYTIRRVIEEVRRLRSDWVP